MDGLSPIGPRYLGPDRRVSHRFDDVYLGHFESVGPTPKSSSMTTAYTDLIDRAVPDYFQPYIKCRRRRPSLDDLENAWRHDRI